MSEALNTTDLMTVNDWRAARGSHLFKSNSSMEWFIRQHRGRLIQEGALIPCYGSRGSLVTPRIDTLIPEIFLEQARAV
jgi:hypothetical protein